MTQPLAIQSWCFRHFKTLPELFEQLKLSGVSATELCGVHVNFADPSIYAGTLAQFKQANIQIVAIGVQKLTGKIEEDRPSFEFCKAAGVKHMGISFAPAMMFDGLKNVEKLADEYDLTLGIHNHGGYDWLGTATILRHIFTNTGPRIGLYLDTAWSIDAKQDPISMVEKFADRLYGIHVKDFVYDRARNFTDVVIGTGNLDLPKLVQTLKQMKYAGPLVIEYEGDVENPTPALKKCVEEMRKLL